MEEWRTVPEFPTYLAHSSGRLRHQRSRQDRKPTDNGAALTISLHDVTTGGMTSRNLGALILSAFVGPRPIGATCSHLNGDYTDNAIANLAWESHRENCARKPAHGTHGVKLDEDAVRAILASTLSHRAIAAEYGVAYSNVGAIKRREIWRHVE